MRTLLTLLIGAVVVIVGAIGFAYSGLYDVAALSPHSGPVAWLLSTTSHASIERRAREVVVPDLSGPALVRAGVNDYEAMCVGCHGAPGTRPDAMGQGLNPSPPDLAESAEHMSPAELFWVTRNGIRMTGMPAWGETHDDAEIWPVVALMTRLPELDPAAYRSLLASAAGSGHHGTGEGGQSHDHEVGGDAAGHPNAVPEHDHGHPDSASENHDHESAHTHQ